MYGGVGVGKTHLLQAIANSCNTRGLRVIYAQAEAFMNDLVESIRSRQQAMFREKYRNVDVLVIDDVQFIAGKESTQEEFFHTFNALYTYNKQIILASDRHPDELTTLEPRLRSRFAGGLIADIKAPEVPPQIGCVQPINKAVAVHIQRGYV
jgi:chromosomal replication initiator protein